MVFGWIKRKIQIASVRAASDDIDRFLLGLRGASDRELGLSVALAAHARHILERNFNWDLSPPDVVTMRTPAATLFVNRLIGNSQKNNNGAMAAGLMVWLHSLRSSDIPEIRLQARQMWGELARGFPYAEEAATDSLEFAGLQLQISGFDQIPEYLRPE